MSVEQTKRTTRDSQTRKQAWRPPARLETPQAPEGMKYRWVRASIRGSADDDNVILRQRQGYEVVRPEDLANTAGLDIRTKEDGKHAGVVTSGDLILMQVPTDIAEQRQDYYEGQATKMQKAVDQELDKAEDSKMPILRESKTKVKTGRDAFQE